MQLQRIGQCIIFIEKCLAYLWYPLVGISIEITVYRFTSPKRNIIQVNHIIVSTTINECPQLTISNR